MFIWIFYEVDEDNISQDTLVYFRLFSESVCVVFTFCEWTSPSFPLGEIGTLALFKFFTLLWETFYKNESNLLEIF